MQQQLQQLQTSELDLKFPQIRFRNLDWKLDQASSFSDRQSQTDSVSVNSDSRVPTRGSGGTFRSSLTDSHQVCQFLSLTVKSDSGTDCIHFKSDSERERESAMLSHLSLPSPSLSLSLSLSMSPPSTLTVLNSSFNCQCHSLR